MDAFDSWPTHMIRLPARFRFASAAGSNKITISDKTHENSRHLRACAILSDFWAGFVYLA